MECLHLVEMDRMLSPHVQDAERAETVMVGLCAFRPTGQLLPARTLGSGHVNSRSV